MCKRAKLIPNVKPRIENNEDVSKFRPINLLNTGSQVLDKVLIKRINHHVYCNNLINNNQYGLNSRNTTTDTAMAVKDFVERFKAV